jgi:putative peptidoglycan lipid II flippase
LRNRLNQRIGRTGLPKIYLAKLWAAALAASAIGFAIHHFLHFLRHHSAVLSAAAILVPYGAVYFAATLGLGLPEASALLRRVTRFVENG